MTVVMGLIIVSFVIWGVGDMLRGFTASTVASVGGAKISAQEYRIAYDRTIQQYQRRLQPPVHQRGGAPDRPRPQRPPAAPERSGGRRGGAQARPQHFRRRLARDHHHEPGFPRQVRRLRSRPLRRRAARHGHDRARVRLRIAQAGAEAVHRRGADRPASPRRRPRSRPRPITEGQSRSVDYFLLPAAAAGEIAAPSEEALKTFFNDRKSSYRAPEYRAMDVLALEPETIANPAEVSDADAEAAYAKIAGKDPRFGAPEKRDLQQILFPNDADASAAEAKLKAGDELRRPDQGARPQARRHRPRRDDQGRHARQGRGRRGVRPAAGGRERGA